jgi:predicted amidohydrolase
VSGLLILTGLFLQTYLDRYWKMNIKIALAQLELELANPERNLQQAKRAVSEAARGGAEIVLLPELWASGYDLENAREYASPLGSGYFASMQDLALENRIAVGGSLIEVADKTLFNTFLFVDQEGKELGSYRKAHLFGMIGEQDSFAAGKQLRIIDSPQGRIGLALCYDLRFPELFRAYAVEGVQIILLVAEWPRRRIAHWDILLQARAIENQCFIAAVNKVGTSKDQQLGGNSAVIGPMGEVLVKGNADPGILIAEVDLEEVGKVRNWMPVLKDRNLDIYN